MGASLTGRSWTGGSQPQSASDVSVGSGSLLDLQCIMHDSQLECYIVMHALRTAHDAEQDMFSSCRHRVHSDWQRAHAQPAAVQTAAL